MLLRDLISPAPLERCGVQQLPVLSMTMHDGILLQSDRFKKSLASVDQSAYKVVKRNQLVVGFPIDEGVLYIQHVVDVGIMSPAYDVWDVDQSKVDLNYLELSLHSPQAMLYYKTNLRGTTARRRSLPKDVLLDLPLFIPDIDSQKRIVRTVFAIKRIITHRQRQLLALDTLIKARFVEMFGDETNPYDWPIINVEDIANVSVGVVIKPASYYTDADHGIKAFRSLNIGEMIIKDTDWVYFSQEGNEKNSKSLLKENDILIVRSGAPGTACVVTSEYVGCNAIDIIIARPNKEKVNPYYLCMYTNMPHGKKQINEGTGGAAQQHFNVGKYNKLKLMLPPKDRQDTFFNFITQIDKSKVAVQTALNKAQQLFDSLMQQYFG